ncbi:MAG TPA: 2OG-Fe dioxygenase family protein [Burkholderiaceae bacterium]|nr:2OG-Fe dioxygenase family protein [Burkholderiaceae bacterium]
MSGAPFPPPTTPWREVDAALRNHGLAVLDPAGLHARLDVERGALDAWTPYWDRLTPDMHLRDGGAYRRRRHGSFIVEGDAVRAVPHRAHWQPLDYNALHGGIERWFEPLEEAFVAEPLWPRLLSMLGARASALRGSQVAPEARSAPAPQGGVPALGRPGGGPWFVEAHPFRIDAAGGIGRPTPEGAHRDGVDLVAVMLVARENVKGGESRVFAADGPAGQRFTMTEPWTTLLLDDARVIHETTPIQPLDPARPSHRDTLVITLRAAGFQDPPRA